MERLHIVGRRPLAGEVAVSGSKNASLALLAASLLSDTPVRIAGMPRLGDVATMRQLLHQLGAPATVDAHDLWHIDPSSADRHQPSETLVRQTRASICLLGPLLATQGRGVIALPGGCNLGHRPVDLHLRGLRALG
ncbi:MAG: UDP-N-acetylglucosamine 1-carboxyvinyltransferase, partial [Pirellulales bacterium]